MTLAAVIAGAASAQVTQLVSVDHSPRVDDQPALSADGRFVVWIGFGVFVRDRWNGTTTQIATSASSYDCTISADGRYVAYMIAHGVWQVYAYDRMTGTTEIVSVDSNGNLGNDFSAHPEISADGRFVVFDSQAQNLDPRDFNARSDVFLRDRQTGTTEVISLNPSGTTGDGPSYSASISADGRFVAFVSEADDLVPGDTNQDRDVFVRDRLLGTTELVSVGLTALTDTDETVRTVPSISADGRFVAFDWNYCYFCGFHWDLYLRDRQLGVTELVSVDSTGQPGDDSSFNPYITPDGRYVVFDSDAANLASPDSPGSTEVFVRDRLNHTTERVSVDWRGRPGDGPSGSSQSEPKNRMSADGRWVGFQSFATNLVPTGGSTSGESYVHDRSHDEHPILCDPGVDGVLPCPCANAPSNVDRGCDNSRSTGGARLDVEGGEYLSSDSLYFTLGDATPSALCMLLQGSRPNAGGAVLGQGIRCVGGTLRTLYVARTSAGGGVVVPDFDAGDPTVHARATAAGDPIPSMHARWYMALYRDPVVLGACPATSTFNTTPTREVLWLP